MCFAHACPLHRAASSDESCAQGPRPRLSSTRGKKKWNKGAPLSKQPKMPGIGRGQHPNSKAGKKLDDNKSEQRDPQLPTSVPMPAALDEVNNMPMRTMLAADGGAVCS